MRRLLRALDHYLGVFGVLFVCGMTGFCALLAYQNHPENYSFILMVFLVSIVVAVHGRIEQRARDVVKERRRQAQQIFERLEAEGREVSALSKEELQIIRESLR
jgi:hypothetical protein